MSVRSGKGEETRTGTVPELIRSLGTHALRVPMGGRPRWCMDEHSLPAVAGGSADGAAPAGGRDEGAPSGYDAVDADDHVV